VAACAPPSGAQYEIAAHGQRAILVEVGGGIRRYVAEGRDVLDGYDEQDMCDGARGTPLIPWPNRLADGSYRFDGRDYQVALTEPDNHNAIHGLLRWRSWTPRVMSESCIVLGIVLRPSPGYPFTLDVSIEYALGTDGLTVTTTATNCSAVPCPYAAGQHPYLWPGEDGVDDVVLTLDAGTRLPTDARGLPTGRCAVAGSAYDFRNGRRIGDQLIDYAFTELARDAVGRAWVRLDAPGGHCTRLWVDEHHRFVEIYTGDTLAPERRRRGLGVEPMTCAPNGLASGDGLRCLAPGQTLTTRWGILPPGAGLSSEGRRGAPRGDHPGAGVGQ
jgi:aldose 1-epimerase